MRGAQVETGEPVGIIGDAGELADAVVDQVAERSCHGRRLPRFGTKQVGKRERDHLGRAIEVLQH